MEPCCSLRVSEQCTLIRRQEQLRAVSANIPPKQPAVIVLCFCAAQTSIKDAIKAFEAKSQCVAAEAEKVLLYGQLPPIAKMDNSLGTLKACKHLALSSNCIEKITGLKGLGERPALF